MDEERISKLPAPILRRILSFLSQEEAVKTCVLSKSWRHLGSTRPNFVLKESYFGGDKQKFMDVLDKCLQVYSDQNLCIEDFSVTSVSNVDPEFVSRLEKWISIVVHEMGAKEIHLSIGHSRKRADTVKIPSAVFESQSLHELHLRSCNLRPININIGSNHHLKTLFLHDVCIEEETNFAKFLLSCSVIEHLSLCYCKGLRTIHMPNYHNLKSFVLYNNNNNGIYFPSVVGYKYFPGLTCLRLTDVTLSNEWFNSFSRNFPCLEELQLSQCNGFDELQLSSPSIKKLHIKMDEYTTKASIDAPSIKYFYFGANISQSISVTTICSEWKSHLHLSLDFRASLWLPKISELVAAFCQSQIDSLVLYHSENNEHMIGRLSGINSVHKPAVAMERLELILDGLYYDSFHSDLMNGLFRIIRPREIRQQFWYKNAQHVDLPRKRNEVVDSLCRTLQMGRSRNKGMSFWQQDFEEASLEVQNGGLEEWHLVPRTRNWSEYVATIKPLENMYFCVLCFRLKWRELADNSFGFRWATFFDAALALLFLFRLFLSICYFRS